LPLSLLIHTSGGSSNPKAIVQELITRASQLLGPLIEKTTASDTRAKTHGKKWPGRHRLQVLLDAAERSVETLPTAIQEPWLLAGEPRRISKEGAVRILNKAMRKARRQLESERPGIVAICTYNQIPEHLDTLKTVSRQRLSRKPRPNLIGLIVFSLNTMISAL